MTTHHFEIGLGIEDLRQAAAAVSSMLDVQLDEIDSDTYGGLHFRGRTARGEVFVHRNFDPVEDEWHAPDARDMPIIVKVFYSKSPARAVAGNLEEALGSPTRVLGEHVT